MSRIHPLYLLLLPVVLILFFGYKTAQIQEEIAEQKAAFLQSQKIAHALVTYKKRYRDKEQLKKSIAQILKLTALKKSKITQKWSDHSLLLQASKISAPDAAILLNKILNGAYIIKMIDLKKLNTDKLALRLEITW